MRGWGSFFALGLMVGLDASDLQVVKEGVRETFETLSMPTFFHSGDAGDVIYAIPTMRALGGGALYFDSRPWTRSRFGSALLRALRPLLEEQDCIEGVFLHEGEAIDYDFSTFRNGGYKLGNTIVERERRWMGVPIDLSKPWLSVGKETKETKDRIVVNRAERWHGFHFPWCRIVEVFRRDMLFIGLRGEHQAFCKAFGEIEYLETVDLIEAGKAIAGAAFFIGSQSACNAIANGLHKASLLEACPYAPDCFLPRGNAAYCIDGSIELELLGKRLEVPSYHPMHGYVARVEEKEFRSDETFKAVMMARAECARRRQPELAEMIEAEPYWGEEQARSQSNERDHELAA